MSPPAYLRRLGAPLITHKLADPADNAPGHLSDRLGVTAPGAESAPSVFTHPPRTDGAILFISNHEAENTRG